MSMVSKINFNSIEYAKRNNFARLLNVSMKDGSSAKLMWNADRASCLFVKKGKIIGHQGFISKDDFVNKMINLLTELQKRAKDGVNVFEEYFVSAYKIVK